MKKQNKPHKYTTEQKEFIFNNYKGRTSEQLADLFNSKFKTNLTPKQMAYFRQNNKLNSGLTGRFEKGHKTWNKGLKTGGGPEHTLFKKGQLPPNTHPIGTIIKRTDGYTYKKIANTKPSRKGWVQLHRLIWEEAHGPIPEGCYVRFLDGNSDNLELDNLELITQEQHAYINKNRMIYDDPDLNKTAVMVAKVVSKAHKRMRGENK